jgi:hypothetical protein
MDGQGMRLLRGRPSHVPTEYCFWRLLSVFRPEAGGRERESRVKAGKNLWPPLIRGVRIQNLSLTGVLADGRDLEDSLPSGGAWPPARLAAAHHPRRARAAPRRPTPGVRAVSGGPGPGGSPVPRRPPSALSSASSAIDFLTLCHRLKVQLYVLVMIWRLSLWWYIATRHAFPAILVFSMWRILCGQCSHTAVLNIIRNSEKLIKRRQNQLH